MRTSVDCKSCKKVTPSFFYGSYWRCSHCDDVQLKEEVVFEPELDDLIQDHIDPEVIG